MQNSKLREAIDRLVLESLAKKNPIYIDSLGTIAVKNVIDRDSRGIATKAKTVLVLYRDECGVDLKDMMKPLCRNSGQSVEDAYAQWLSVAVTTNNANRMVFELPNVLTLSVDKATLVAQIMPNVELESYLNPMGAAVGVLSVAEVKTVEATTKSTTTKSETIQETEKPKMVESKKEKSKAAEPVQKIEKPKKVVALGSTTTSKFIYLLTGFVIATVMFIVVIYFGGYMNDGNSRVAEPIVAEVQNVVEQVQVIAEPVADSANIIEPKIEPKAELKIESKAEVVAVKKNEPLSYLVLGVFDDKANAETYKAAKQKEGYSPRIFDYYGKHCVALPLDNQDLTSPQVRSLQQKFEGAWYYKF